MEGSDIIRMGWMVLYHSYLRGLELRQCPWTQEEGVVWGRQDSVTAEYRGAGPIASFSLQPAALS